ncbi:FAR1-related sequence 5-like protein [Tanacetum coccineum]
MSTRHNRPKLIPDQLATVQRKQDGGKASRGHFRKTAEGINLITWCYNSIEIEVQQNDEPFVAYKIEEIDTNGYLINHDNSEYESDNQNDDDVDVEPEKDEYNDVMATIFDTLEDAYNVLQWGYAPLHGFEGFKDLQGKGSDGGDKKRRMDLRTRCEAFLRININKDRKWFEKEFKNAHNHELTITPTKVMKHCSYWKFYRSMACKSLMSELSYSGLKPYHIKKVVNSMKNPLESDVTSKQCANVLSEERKQYKENEKEETFEWLFEEFKKCMFNKHPTAIITDQDKAMGNAILKVEQAKDSLSEIKKFNALVVKFLEEQVIRKKSKENVNALKDPCMGSLRVDMMPQICIQDPKVFTTTKGHPKEATRIKSSLEAPKKRRCSYCKELGHYQSACKKKEDEARLKRKA